MSFALDKEGGLKEVVDTAAASGVVMVCSTADEGENKMTAWPASYGTTVAIAACNDDGERLPGSAGGADFFFRGEKVLYEPAAALATEAVTSGGSMAAGAEAAAAGERQAISGSSVATALAAGTASLVLACLQLDGRPTPPAERLTRVRERFEQMASTSHNKQYVMPWKVFGETRRGDSASFFLATPRP